MPHSVFILEWYENVMIKGVSILTFYIHSLSENYPSLHVRGIMKLFVHCCDEINIIQATLASSVRNMKQPMFHKL